MNDDANIAVLAAFFAISTAFTIARFYFDVTRYRKNGFLASSAASSVCAFLAWVLFAIACSMAFWTSRRRITLREATLMFCFILPTGLWMVKASFIAMYFSSKRHLSPLLRRALYFVIAYLIASYAVTIIVQAMWCGAWGKQWDISPQNYCTPFVSVTAISLHSVMNVTSDLLVMALPLILIHQSKVQKRDKWGIGFLILLGGATVATTLVCCSLHAMYRRDMVRYTGTIRMVELLTCVELSIAVTTACLPSLRAVAYRHRESVQKKIVSRSILSTWETRHSIGPVQTPQEEEELEEDQSKLVIMRRLSFDVESRITESEPTRPPKVLPMKTSAEACLNSEAKSFYIAD